MKPNQIAFHRVAMASVVVLASLCSDAAQAAARAVRGPMDDLHVTLSVDYLDGPCTPAAYPTYYHPWPPFTNTWPNISDYVIINCNGHHGSANYSARGAGYVVSPKGNFNKGDVTLVTIYGLDLNPGGEELMITGFDPADPEMNFDGETYTGISKTAYPATSRDLVPIAELGTLLGSDFDLSPFSHGAPGSVVYVFQATMPAKNLGMRTKGVLYDEDFSDTWHVGSEAGGSFGLGTLPGTNLKVTSGAVDVLGVLNAGTTACSANTAGNCLDLSGHEGPGSVSTIPVFDLDPAHTYTVQFTALAQGLSEDLNLTVQLGGSTWDLSVGKKKKTFYLPYTPLAFEAGVPLSFTGSAAADGEHGPVLSGIVLCAKDAGVTGKCPKP